jgi:HK97 family phage major capsid protein
MTAKSHEFKPGGEVRVLFSRPTPVKAVEENGEHKLWVLGAPFGSPKDLDDDGEYFSRNTDFMVEPGDRRPVIYMHGVGPEGKALEKPEAVGKATVKNINNSGLWFEATVDYTKELGKRLWDKAKLGKVRASTGAVAHLFRKAQDGEIKTWAIGELSLLDVGMRRRPANDKALAIALKSVYSDAELEYPEAFIEAEQAGVNAGKKAGVDTGKEKQMRKAPPPEQAPPEQAPPEAKPTAGFVVVEQEGMFVVYAADEAGAPMGEPAGAHLTQEEADAEMAAMMAAMSGSPAPEEAPAEEPQKPPVPPAKMERTMDETVKAVLEALKAEKESEKVAAEAEAKVRADERAKVEAEMKSKTPAWKGGFAFPQKVGKDSKNEATDAFLYWLRTGDAIAAKAAMQEGTSSEGGFLVPNDFYAQIVARRNEKSFVRRLGCLVIQTSRDNVDIPVEGTATTTFVGTAEESNFDENEELVEPITVAVHKFTKLMKVSNELLADQAANLDQFIANDLADKMAMTENRYVAVGTGTNQHWGVLTSDTAFGSQELALTSDQLTSTDVMALAYMLPSEYRENSAWLCHYVSEGQIRQIKDSTWYAFPAGEVAAGNGTFMTTLLGRPIFNQKNIQCVSDATSDAQKHILLIGDFSKYALVERSGLEVVRNPYLYQLSDQTGIFAKFRQGGAPLLDEAFAWALSLVNAS